MREAKTQLVTKDMIMADIIARYPAAAEVMSSYGLHCIGCHANPYESIEAGAASHGMSEHQMNDMLREVNDIAAKGAHTRTVEVADVQELKIDLTEKAAEKVKEFMRNQKKEGYGLKVKAIPGGCSGYSYGMELEKGPAEGDKEIDCHGVKVFIDQESLMMLAGTEIDYVESLQGGGFKFNNPNAHSTCGCGKSFG